MTKFQIPRNLSNLNRKEYWRLGFWRLFGIWCLGFGISALCNPTHAAEKIRMVTTTKTFASITQEIAGDLAEIYAIAPANRDLHFISPNPKDVLKLRKADVFIHGGLDLESWRGPLLDAVGRKEFLGSGERTIDLSRGIPLLEIPKSVSRAQGDVHLYGNPHYWLDPRNGKIIAQNIYEGLAALYPDVQTIFKQNLDSFIQRLDSKIAEWERRSDPLKGTPVIAYHKSFSYLAKFMELEVVDYIEPKPGIPPTAKHISHLIALVKEKKVKWILKEPFYENKTPKKITEQTGARVITIPQGVGDVKEAGDYVGMFEFIFDKLLSS